MGKVNLANLKKTYYYLKKNGVSAAFSAVRERLQKNPYEEYRYEELTEQELSTQRKQEFLNPVTFSILVPAYNPAPEYLSALLDSVQAQTYPHWELVLADASTDTQVEETVRRFCKETEEKRIRYIRLSSNEGISENSNQGLKAVTGEYTALLDHDDLLTPDALYENAIRILQGREHSAEPQILYSDEDKCDEKGETYYEVYYKKDFNLDLLLSNNYICHFLVMKTEMMQKLQFRCNFDGSQDYDLLLRGVAEILPDEGKIVHIPRVLYHWRCHSGSTAVNPQSKRYAYEAGSRALEDFIRVQGWKGRVTFTKHLGFFKIVYEPDLFTVRKDAGVVGGRLLDRRGRIAGGIYNENGVCPYAGLAADFSGYMHQAALTQDAWEVDVRCMKVRPELQGLFREITGVMYREDEETGCFDSRLLDKDTDVRRLGADFCKAVREAGYRILWEPSLTKKLKEELTNESNGGNS